jgi:1-acyl-sn-glycerol-3-phosphate acyltransferase
MLDLGRNAPPTDPAKQWPADRRRHYGGEHHALSLVDRVGDRLERVLDLELLQRDGRFIERTRPYLDLYLRYFDAEVLDFDRVPQAGPFLIVSNHSGGLYMPDYWAFVRRWIDARGVDAPLYSLAYDVLFSIPAASTLARRFGAVPASHANAGALLDAGMPVLVYPGGDEDDYRPWTERHRVDLRGHTGFVRLALRHGVPVVPLVSHGPHDAIIVLTRGERIARTFGLDRLRVQIFPLIIGPPWGIAPINMVTWPLPAKVTSRVCEPFDWSGLGPDAADDPHAVRQCYEELLGRMQATMDELVDAQPHPVLHRLRTALSLTGRAGRAPRPG